MKRFSRVCTGIMLALVLLLLDSGVLLGTFGQLPHRSYLAALLAAALLAAGLVRLGTRERSLAERWGVRRMGWILALFCFVLNLIGAVRLHAPIYGDPLTFWETSLALAAGGRPENAALLALFPHLLGYSSFLSVFLRLFGEQPMVSYVLNVCLCTLSGLLLYALVLRWGTARQAAWAFLLWSLCPSKLLFNGMILSDGLYTCLLLATFLLLAALEARGLAWKRGIPAALLAGLLLRLINISRPIAAIVPIALLLWILFLRGEKSGTGRWLAFLALLLLVYVPLGRLWDAHVEKLLGEAPAPIPGYNIYVGFNTATSGTYCEEDMDRLAAYRDEEGSAVAAQERMFEDAKQRIRENRKQLGRLFVEKLAVLIGSDEAAAYGLGHYGANGVYEASAVLSDLFYYLVILLANGGLLRLWRGRERRVVLCLPLFVLGLILAQMLVEVSSRYHYSIVPILCMLAALCLTREQGGNYEG